METHQKTSRCLLSENPGSTSNKRHKCQILKCNENKTKDFSKNCKKYVCGKCTGRTKKICVNCQNEKQTCFVVLEKLDEKLINQYLQKCDLKKRTKNVDSVKSVERQSLYKSAVNCSGCFKNQKNPKENGGHKRKNLEDSVKKSKLKRKKIKVKTLGYADDVSNKIVSEVKEFVTENGKRIKLRFISDGADNGEKSCSKLKKTYESDKIVAMKCKKKSTLEVEKKRNNVILKAFLEDSGGDRTENHVVALSTADTEIEIVEEYLKLRSIHQNKNCVKTEANCNKEQLLVSSDSVQAKVFEEDEYDSREDNEDDKKTVIFEEGFDKNRDSDIFNFDEKEIESARRKLKEREITSRKIQKLMQSKKQSMEGRNSETMKKPKTKVMEPSLVQEVIQVPSSPENVSEDCLKEVCCLIQRLHELYKIILHMQMELRNNNGLSVHFSSAINAYQEQFQREIRKSQKTIIRCYEKMLMSCKNAGKVALIISERTSLSTKDVIEVISQCLLVEGACELKKYKNEAIQKTEKEKVFKRPKAYYNSDISRKIIIEDFERLHVQGMVQKTNYLVPSSNSYLPPEKNIEFSQRVPNESKLTLRTSTVENSDSCSQNRPDCVMEISPPVHQMQRNEHGKSKSYLVQKKILQKLRSKDAIINSRSGQSQQTPCECLVMLPNNDYPLNGIAFPNQSVILPYPKFDCSANVCRFQEGSLLTMPPTLDRRTEIPFPEQFINCNSKNSSANYIDQSKNSTSNSGFRVLSPVVTDDTQYNTFQHQSNLLRTAFPAKTYNGKVNAQRPILTSNETRLPFRVSLTDAVRFSNHKLVNFSSKGPLLHFEEMANNRSSAERIKLRNVPNRVPENYQVLDPTVPKKLTMKNWRLQAGPILDLETVRDKLNPCQSLGEKKLKYHELGNPHEEDSRSRKYVCAQKDCKKPGVRICEDCRSVIYCSETCQLKNWTQKHMIECYQLKKLRG